jgi:hypothetical protein
MFFSERYKMAKKFNKADFFPKNSCLPVFKIQNGGCVQDILESVFIFIYFGQK